MNLAETLALIEALRASGVTRFKSLEHDIEFNGQVTIGQKTIANILDQSPAQQAPQDPVKAGNDEDSKKKIQEMLKVMNMTPDQMARYMFPEDV